MLPLFFEVPKGAIREKMIHFKHDRGSLLFAYQANRL
jgi:hypothetical protein